MLQEIDQAARDGKPAAMKASRLIHQGEAFMLQAAKEAGTPLDEEALGESLAQVAAYSNPWLVAELAH